MAVCGQLPLGYTGRKTARSGQSRLSLKAVIGSGNHFEWPFSNNPNDVYRLISESHSLRQENMEMCKK
jgi:hypothetical protein